MSVGDTNAEIMAAAELMSREPIRAVQDGLGEIALTAFNELLDSGVAMVGDLRQNVHHQQQQTVRIHHRIGQGQGLLYEAFSGSENPNLIDLTVETSRLHSLSGTMRDGYRPIEEMLTEVTSLLYAIRRTVMGYETARQELATIAGEAVQAQADILSLAQDYTQGNS